MPAALARRLFTQPKPLRRVRQLARMLTHRADHLAYQRAIEDARRLGLIADDALAPYRYLGIYLAELISTDLRRRIIMHHYAFLGRLLAPEACDAWRGPTLLWTGPGGEGQPVLQILLDRATLAPMEGESELRFVMDGQTLFTLTFVIALCASIGLSDGDALFIGGIQGGLDCRQQIRIAAKANGEIAPAAMLLIAAKALIRALGVRYVVGVSSEQQAALGYAREKIALSYDDLWIDAGASRSEEGYFIVVPTIAEKPAASGSHRSRTRRRREYKAALLAEIERNVRARLLLPLPPEHAPAY